MHHAIHAYAHGLMFAMTVYQSQHPVCNSKLYLAILKKKEESSAICSYVISNYLEIVAIYSSIRSVHFVFHLIREQALRNFLTV